MEPVEPVLKNIYQSNTYRKDLSWLHFDDEPRVQEMQQVEDQQSYIPHFVVYLTIPSSNLRGKIQSNLRKRTFIERIKTPIFLEAILEIEII